MMFDNFWKYESSDNLYFRSLKNTMADKAIVFLHGLGGSNRYWSDAYKKLGKKYSLYFVDLLGFGHSAKPDREYTLEEHIKALRKFLQCEVLETSVDIVGHSMGALIALGYSKSYPLDVDRVFLLSPGYFLSPEDAKTHINNSHDLATILDDTPAAHVTCELVCSMRPLFVAAAPYFLNTLPRGVAEDVFLHTHSSYFGSLRNLIYGQDVPALINDTNRDKITIIHGTEDQTVPMKNAEYLASKHRLHLVRMDHAGHDFPLNQAEQVVRFLS